MRDSENSGGLVKYDAARLALSEAVAVDEVKHIHDVSAAMKAYARQAKDKQMEIDASEIRIRAERRLGEMIREQKATVGLADGGDAMKARSREGSEVATRPTLADVGIDHKLSSRSQAIASIPEEDFEATLAEHRDQQEAVTAKTMEKLGRQGAEQKQKEETQLHEVTYAMTFAGIAISQLERIRSDDPLRLDAINKVATWIENHREV